MNDFIIFQNKEADIDLLVSFLQLFQQLKVQNLFYLLYLVNRLFLIILQMNSSELLTLKCFLQTIKKIVINSNNLEGHKRRLSGAIHQIEDYIECFKCLDMDKKGVIYPKVLQNFLIKHKYFHNPQEISRFYSKYSHEKPYLSYEDILEALLPHQDYLLITNTLTNPPNQRKCHKKFTYSCVSQRNKTIEYFTAFVLQLQIQYLTIQFNAMREVTKNSLRIGAILWRMLDHNHNNQLTYEKLRASSDKLGVSISQAEWQTYLYWQFHSYKSSINRDGFIRVLDIQEELKRASSACKIDQFKIQQNIYKRAEEDRLRNSRIEQAVRQKVSLMPHFTKSHFREMVKQEHFPFQYLNQKKELKGKVGYRKPNNLIKFVVQREE